MPLIVATKMQSDLAVIKHMQQCLLAIVWKGIRGRV